MVRALSGILLACLCSCGGDPQSAAAPASDAAGTPPEAAASARANPGADTPPPAGIPKVDDPALAECLAELQQGLSGRDLDRALRQVSERFQSEGFSSKQSLIEFLRVSPTLKYTIWDMSRAKVIIKDSQAVLSPVMPFVNGREDGAFTYVFEKEGDAWKMVTSSENPRDDLPDVQDDPASFKLTESPY